MGEANLNLSEYEEDEWKTFKLPLNKCDDPNAYIEIGMKAFEEGKGKGNDKRKQSAKKPVEEPSGDSLQKIM